MDVIMRAIVAYFKANHQQTEYLDWDIPIQVCQSAAGFYVGQLAEYGMPYSRLSCEYFRTAEEAEEALRNRTFTARLWL